MPNTLSLSRKQSGITLLDTIVAVLLIASCTIGIAAIYAQRQNIARGGRLHEQAVALAQQMATAIRDNSNETTNFETMLGTTCNRDASQSSQNDKQNNKRRSNEKVNVVACWQDAVVRELTNGSANISLDHTSVPAQYVIMVSWSEPRSGTASYVLRVTPGTGKTEPSKPVDAARAAG